MKLRQSNHKDGTFNVNVRFHFDLDVLKVDLDGGRGRRRRDRDLRGQLGPELDGSDELFVARRVEPGKHLLDGGRVDVGAGRAQFRVEDLTFHAGNFDQLFVGCLRCAGRKQNNCNAEALKASRKPTISKVESEMRLNGLSV